MIVNTYAHTWIQLIQLTVSKCPSRLSGCVNSDAMPKMRPLRFSESAKSRIPVDIKEKELQYIYIYTTELRVRA